MTSASSFSTAWTGTVTVIISNPLTIWATAFRVILDPGGKIEHTAESRRGQGQVMGVSKLAAQLSEIAEYNRLHKSSWGNLRSSLFGQVLCWCGMQSQKNTTLSYEMELFDIQNSETNV